MMKNGKLLVAPALLWLSIFFVIPLLIVVAVSFAGRTPYGQVIFSFTFANYLRFLEPLYLKIFADTLGVAIVTTIATILMGYPLAYTIAQLPKKWQQPGLILVMIPFWINFLIRSYAWVIILRSQGVVNTLLLKLGLIDQPGCKCFITIWPSCWVWSMPCCPLWCCPFMFLSSSWIPAF